ncbi:hypothetical protein GJAV_G00149150 [Gymnothorax javanicus]|nr:hypothetical protein GJAV_G00149150 [Gymnothorax javanicus]
MKCAYYKTQLASIMELLVQAAVTEMGNLFDEDTAIVLRLEVAGQQTDNEVLKKKIQTQNELMTSRFASTMGLLTKEAVDKITRLVDATRQQLLEIEIMSVQDTVQESYLNVLAAAECVEEQTIVKEEDNPMDLVLKTKCADLEEHSPESSVSGAERHKHDSDAAEPQQGLQCKKAVWAESDFGKRFYNDHYYWEGNENVGLEVERHLLQRLCTGLLWSNMGLLEQCKELFKTSGLYDVLGVAKDASDAEIRRGYYKVSLLVHPDRAPDDELATKKFQVLGKVYAVLSDKEQKAVYDEQGTVDEESDSLGQDRNWEEYWRLLFPKITLSDILEFEKKYKGTDEESEDVRRLYLQYEGDMDMIMASALCCSQEDEPRIADIIQSGIDSGELPTYRTFTHESKQKKAARKRKADKEQKEAEEMKKELGLKADDSLVAMLQQRQKSRERGFNSFLSDLEAKYSKKGKATSGKRGKK